MKHKFLCLILLLVTMLALCTAANAAGTVVASGYCGGNTASGYDSASKSYKNLSWTLDSDGELVISGSGDMIDSKPNNAPWYSHRSEIRSVRIDAGVSSIGGYAFYYCSSLTSITIPDSVTSIGAGAFSSCSSLKDVYITDLAAWCRIKFGGPSATPMYYADSIYCNGNKIVSTTVPDGVTELNYTFCGFKDLIKVTIPDGVTSIGNIAFSSCTSLTSINIPNSVTSIGNSAFYGCSSLMSITIPDSVTSIGSSAFSSCTSLTSVNIPDSVTSIGNRTFYYCISLLSINIPSSAMSIGEEAFYGCSSLMSITIPNSVTSIGNSAFTGCSSLTSINIPNSVTSIGSSAFNGCSSLTSITIPDGVTSIGSSAFSRCSSLTSIIIPDSVTSIGVNAFTLCFNLTDVYISDLAAWCRISFGDVTANPLNYVGGNLYLNGAKVELLEIPESVQVIQSNLFCNISCIKAVAIPKTLVGVAANAFMNCGRIEKVFYAGSETEWKTLPISAGNECLTGAEIFYNATPSDYYCKVSCAVSPGGTVSVAKNAYDEGETVTVTATPYTGYELTEIRVDGVKIAGNTFSATKNHTVSAVFSKLPVYGGTESSRIGDIALCTDNGEAQQTVPKGRCLVTVPITNLKAVDSVTVFLASYTSEGQYQGMAWLTFRNLPVGTKVEATLPLDNSSGKIAVLRAYLVTSILDPTPLGNVVTFGTF